MPRTSLVRSVRTSRRPSARELGSNLLILCGDATIEEKAPGRVNFGSNDPAEPRNWCKNVFSESGVGAFRKGFSWLVYALSGLAIVQLGCKNGSKLFLELLIDVLGQLLIELFIIVGEDGDRWDRSFFRERSVVIVVEERMIAVVKGKHGCGVALRDMMSAAQVEEKTPGSLFGGGSSECRTLQQCSGIFKNAKFLGCRRFGSNETPTQPPSLLWAEKLLGGSNLAIVGVEGAVTLAHSKESKVRPGFTVQIEDNLNFEKTKNNIEVGAQKRREARKDSEKRNTWSRPARGGRGGSPPPRSPGHRLHNGGAVYQVAHLAVRSHS
ncbi:hypothetical protein QBC44DRAFT_313196 [Cladorrhinum sp. PSN332]|nr:hypothetical protein QBC44DRAFT_313196 [Cladorrhinum sp. PSN332]